MGLCQITGLSLGHFLPERQGALEIWPKTEAHFKTKDTLIGLWGGAVCNVREYSSYLPSTVTPLQTALKSPETAQLNPYLEGQGDLVRLLIRITGVFMSRIGVISILTKSS